jgi:hypothetical protein
MIRLIAALGIVLLVAGCGGIIPVGHSSATHSAGAEPGVDSYLCSGTTSDELLQWRDSGGYLSGTYQYANLSGQAPSEQVSSNSGNLTGTLNGTAITMSIGLSQDLYGTLSGGQLTLNVPQQNGTIQAVTCSQASIDDWNKAVGALNSQAGSDNQQANQAQAQASHDQAVSNAQSSLSRDVTSVQNDASSLENDNTLAGDVNTMKQDYQNEQNDWQTEQKDAGTCGVSGDAGAISGDASAIGGDQSALQSDIGSLQSNGMASVKTDISTINSDMSAIRNLGATPDTDPSSAIAAGHKALTDSQNAIDWATNQGNQIAAAANSLSNTAQSYANSHGC